MTSRLRVVLLAGCAVLSVLHAEEARLTIVQSLGGPYAGEMEGEGIDGRPRGGGVGPSALLAPVGLSARSVGASVAPTVLEGLPASLAPALSLGL